MRMRATVAVVIVFMTILVFWLLQPIPVLTHEPLPLAQPGSQPPAAAPVSPTEHNADSFVPAEAKASVTGKVLVENTKEPVAEITVHARPKAGADIQTTTDENGRFILSGLVSNAKYELIPIVPEEWGLFPDKPVVSFRRGETLLEIDILLHEPSGSISGRVLDKTPAYGELLLIARKNVYSRQSAGPQFANKPLGDIVVTLLGPTGTTETSSGPDGEFVFSSLPPGRYTVSALPPDGAVVAEEGGRLHFCQEIGYLPPNESKTDVELSFRFDGVSLTGHITDTGGNPIESAEVVATRRDRPIRQDDGSPDLTPHHTVHAVSDERGGYRLDGLLPADIDRMIIFFVGKYPVEGAQYVVRAQAAGYGSVEIPVPIVPASLRPSAREIMRLLLVAEKSDKELLPERFLLLPASDGNVITGIDLALPKAATVSGRLLDTDRKVLPNSAMRIQCADPREKEITLVPHRAVESWDAKTDEQGHFQFDEIPPGQFLFEADGGDGWRPVLNGPLTVREGQDIAELDVFAKVYKYHGDISGRVVDALSNRPIADFSVGVDRIESPEDQGTVYRGRWGPVTVDVKRPGSFLIKDVSCGIAILKVSATGYAEKEFNVNVFNGQTTTATIPLGREGTLRVRAIRDGVSSSSATIHAILNGNGPQYMLTFNDSPDSGWYEAHGLANGQYRISVVYSTVPVGKQGTWGVEAQMRAWTDIEAGRITKMDIDLNGNSGLAITISGSEQKYQVFVFDAAERGPIILDDSLLTNAHLHLAVWEINETGRYEIPGLFAGTYRIVCRPTRPGGDDATQEQMITLQAGAVTEVEFHFE